MACTGIVCGTGNSTAPKPGDPDNNVTISAAGQSGGIEVSWTYPAVNPFAVAYVDVYRSKYDVFSLAVKRSRVSGDSYFDRIGSEDIRTYYYWIKIVSVNGTEGAEIGPASAAPNASVHEVLQQLSGTLDMSYLSESVRQQLNKVSILEVSLGVEINNRLTQDALMGEALTAVQSETGQALTYINEEISQRRTAQEALLDSINTLSVGMAGNSAAIVEERLLRADAYNALATEVSALQTTVGENTTSIETVSTSVDGLAAQYTVKIDNNGYVTGFGLASTPVDDVPYSEFAVQANSFKFAAPDGTKTPFSVVDTGGGQYKTLLNSDVLIGGNVDIANLSTGSLASDVKLRLGDGIIDLDGSGEIRVYKNLQPNADYVRLSSGEIRFLKYIDGSYQTYNYLSRLESGEANNNTVVTIPGYWKSQPRVMVSPASLQMYNAAYAAQNQAINCKATSIVETAAGSMKWQFTPVATLTLASGTVSGAINDALTTPDNVWYSSNYTTNPNTSSINLSVDVQSNRGTGTVNQYAYRQVTIYIQYWNGATWIDGAYKTVPIGAALGYVNATVSLTFPSSGTWTYRVKYAAADAGGNFSTGALTYDYATDLHVNNIDPASIALSIFPGTGTVYTKSQAVSVPGYSVPGGWTITSVRYLYDVAYYQYVAHQSTGWSRSTVEGKNFSKVLQSVTANTPYQAGNSSLTNWQTIDYTVNTNSFNPVICTATSQVSNYSTGRSDTSMDIRKVSVWVTRSKPQTGSTIPSNTGRLSSYVYNLSTAQVLATGSLNWIAIGE